MIKEKLSRVIKIVTLCLLTCLCNLPARSQELIVMKSPKYLKANDSIFIFTPEGKKPHATVILLHGWGGSYKDWTKSNDIQKLSDSTGFRFICPDGLKDSWYVNWADTSKIQMRDFLNKEFIPEMYKRFDLNPETTFIDGLSMGGHGAINLFIDNYDKFKAAGSLSGVLDLQLAYDTYMEKLLFKSWKKSVSAEREKIVGLDNARFNNESADRRIKLIAGKPKMIVVSCGYSDYFAPCTISFAKVCRENNVPIIETLSPGTHSWTFWKYALDQHLMYFQRIMDGKEMGYDNGRKIDKVKPAVPKEGGSPELIVMQSPKYLKCNDSIYVFTPENAQPHATIILLHGWQGDYKAWSDRVDIQAVCNETGFRIICPDGFYNGWYMNNSDKNKMQAKDFFNKEFFPQIFSKYNLDPQTTFIDGLSMGGHGAVTLFIDNQKLFRAAGSMSGVLDLNDCYNHYAEPEKLSTGLSQDMKKIVGDDLSRFSKESAISRVNRVKRNNKFIIASCGYNDYMSKGAEKFCSAAWKAKVLCIETLSPGYHSWRFWEYALYQHIWYFQRIIDDKGMGVKK